MKLWQYHALSLFVGCFVLWLCAFLLPITLIVFCLMFGYHFMLIVVAYIVGRFILSYVLPGTYKKIQEKGCQV